MKKRVTIIILIIISLSIIINLYSISFGDNKNKIEKVSTKETFTDKKNMLSIMVIDENGSYTESQDRTSWPDANTYEYYGSECTDSEGTIVPSEEAVTFENNIVHIKTKNTIYCTLYFYNLKISPLLKSLYKTTGPGYLKTVVENDELLRYVGTYIDANEHRLNNYICFGTTDESTCLGNKDTYMYRIIGITTENVNRELELVPNQLKVIKAIPVKENGISEKIAWNNQINDTKWDEATVQTYLNKEFLSTMQEIVRTYNWINLISNPKWYIGDKRERLSYEETKVCSVLNHQIGLMYASDYYNSWKYNENTNSWLNICHGQLETNILCNSVQEWTMSRLGEYASNLWSSWYVRSNGDLQGHNLDIQNAIRPVFYLMPDITLTGSGTEENPFIIGNV